MTRHSLLPRRSVGRSLGSLWLAAVAAVCLLTFGGAPHPSSVAAGSSGHVPASTASAHLVATQSSDLVTREVTRAASPAGAHHVGFPSSAAAASAGLLLVGGWFLLLVRKQRRRLVSRQYGPAAARAPPLVA